jgi:hypothetical protein
LDWRLSNAAAIRNQQSQSAIDNHQIRNLQSAIDGQLGVSN